ncbi:lysoplasmalogenase [Microtetraspora niveoalba]|uniref:lysoplasmalogenase n=1 Tax=Microtetraspora niveoalba TaxID=46175 RepID=UPI000837688A|nr:lysoplasmalogenase [Microtetraspora niveoalba]
MDQSPNAVQSDRVPGAPARFAGPVLIAFWACSVVHLVAVLTEPGLLDPVSKALLMPLLALWVLARRGPGIIVAALLASAAGDIALEIDGMFVPGMGFFAVAHVCYITFFVRERPAFRTLAAAGQVGAGATGTGGDAGSAAVGGAADPGEVRGRRAGGPWVAVAVYGVVWVVLVAALWPGLGALQVPVAAYSLVLTATAITSSWYGLRAGVGGALFFLSDTLIAFGIADLDFPYRGFAIMATYIVGQYLLASAIVRRRSTITGF